MPSKKSPAYKNVCEQAKRAPGPSRPSGSDRSGQTSETPPAAASGNSSVEVEQCGVPPSATGVGEAVDEASAEWQSSSPSQLSGFVIGPVQDGHVPTHAEIRRIMAAHPERVRVVIVPDEQLEAMRYGQQTAQPPSRTGATAAGATASGGSSGGIAAGTGAGDEEAVEYQCMYGFGYGNQGQDSPRPSRRDRRRRPSQDKAK